MDRVDRIAELVTEHLSRRYPVKENAVWARTWHYLQERPRLDRTDRQVAWGIAIGMMGGPGALN